MGGSLALAAQDRHRIQVDHNSVFGFSRRPADVWRAADMGWRRHVQQMSQLLTDGYSPTETIYLYLAKYHTKPHQPQQIRAALNNVLISDGRSVSAWRAPTLEFRSRAHRGGDVMTNTFGGITTTVTLALTAEDWQNATPAEWDAALSAGEVVMVVGELLGAFADADTQRHETNVDARSAW